MSKFKAVMMALIIFTVAGLPGHASAHVLAENNGVSAVLHMPPYDAPEAGTPTRIEFEFGTDTGGFRIADYDVSIVIKDDGKVVASSPVTAPYFGASATGRGSVTFPRIAVYDVRLEGKPKAASEPAFVMDYSVRVATGNGAATKPKDMAAASQTVYIGGAVFILFVMFAARQIALGGRYKRTDVRKGKP